MENFVVAVVGFVAAAIYLLFLVILSPALGALAGWIVAMVFPTTAAKLLAATGFAAYQWGALLGFAGGFFRSTVNKS